MQCSRRNLFTPCLLLIGVALYMIVTMGSAVLRNRIALTSAFQLPTLSACPAETRHRLVNLPLSVSVQSNVDVTSFEISGCFVIDSEKSGLYRIVHKRNFEQTDCRPTSKTFFPPDKHEEHTALASKPGSGNTWTRHLLEELTGIHTGSIYGAARIDHVFQGEHTTDNVIAVKTHGLLGTNHGLVNFTRAIVVIRDPFEAKLADYNRMKLRNKTGILSQFQFNEEEFKTKLSGMLQKEDKGVARWIREFEGDMLVLFYERLKTDLLNSLTKMAAFCKSEVTLEKLWCIFQNQEGVYHRGEKPKWMSRENLVDDDMETKVSFWMEDIKNAIRKGNIPTN